MQSYDVPVYKVSRSRGRCAADIALYSLYFTQLKSQNQLRAMHYSADNSIKFVDKDVFKRKANQAV